MFNQIIEFITDSVANNDFFRGGFVLAIVGSVLVYCRKIPRIIYGFIKRLVVCTIIFDSKDSLFKLFQSWIDYNQLAKNKRNIRIESDEIVDPPIIKTIFDRRQYLIKHNKMTMLISRSKEDSTGSNSASSGNMMDMLLPEMYSISVMVWNKKKLLNMLTDILNDQTILNRGMVKIYRYSWGYWDEKSKQRPKSFDKLIFSNNLVSEIINDLHNFAESKDWYDDKQIPYQRGYLFSGPPGTGKTSMVLAIASTLNYKICTLDLSDIDSDTKLKDAFISLPSRSILLIEDFDSFFNGRKNQNMKSKVTFSGFLNAINGVTYSSGRLMILTTNQITNIDSALTRVGRIDKHFHVGYLELQQTISLFNVYFPELKNDIRLVDFCKKISSNNIPPSDLIGHFVVNRYDIDKLFDFDMFMNERESRIRMEEEIKKESVEELKEKEDKSDEITENPTTSSATC